MKALKLNSYDGGDLKGRYLLTRKFDGVCVHLNCPERTAESKRGKPLHNFDGIFDEYPDTVGIFEVFRKNWDTSVSLARRHDHEEPVKAIDLISLWPERDPRLPITYINDPTEEQIEYMLERMLAQNHEGLVLVPVGPSNNPLAGKKSIKVKDEITIDIRVTGVTEGTGKHSGKLGAMITEYGNVGTGLDDKTREELWAKHLKGELVGEIIECSFMEWTPAKKMRHPRFKRVRWDKDTENLEKNAKRWKKHN
jgi:hypothetical protein